MLARLATVLALIALLYIAAACSGGGGGADTEDEVTRGGEGKRAEIEAKFAELRAEVRPGEDDPILIATGQKQFRRKCAFCHGVDGQKKIPLAVEAKHRVSNFAPDDIAVQIHSGVNIHGKVRNHKQFPSLKGADLYATLLYVQNFYLQGKTDANRYQPWRDRLDDGQRLFARHCASCHAVDGVTMPPEATAVPAELTPATPAEATQTEPIPAEVPPADPAPVTDPDAVVDPNAQTQTPEPAPAEPAPVPTVVTGPAFDREYFLTHSPQSMAEAVADQAKHPNMFPIELTEQERWTIAYWLQSQLYELP